MNKKYDNNNIIIIASRAYFLHSEEVYNMYYMTMLLWMFITGWEEFVGAMDFKR
jgi:hypothetical protein